MVSDLARKLGFCVICGKRVYDKQEYLEAVEGYCHRMCISEINTITRWKKVFYWRNPSSTPLSLFSFI